MKITELLEISQKEGASDLHLAAGLPPLLRIDGDLQRLDSTVFDQQALHSQLIDLMNDKQQQDYENQI